MDINGDMIMYNKKNPLRCFFAFEGYNSQGMALDKLKERYTDFDWVCVGRSEIDKYAILAANAVYPQYADRNYGDISKIDWNKVPDFDLLTYSFPCTDISSAGQQKGLTEGSGTRSSLLWECKKAIEAKKPKYLLMENVKALTSKKFLPYLKKWIAFLDGLGYSNYTKVLNSKDYGVPQNRERVFVVSILGDEQYQFPEPFELKLRLKDVLESNVDEKYYLSRKMLEKATFEHKETSSGICYEGDGNKGGQEGVILSVNGICFALTATDYKQPKQIAEPKIIQVCNILEEKGFSNPQRGRIYSEDGISPTINTFQGGGKEIKIVTYTRDKKGKVVNRRLVDVANTVHTSTGSGGNTDSFVAEPWKETQLYRIRKLTERECFRLMGVTDADIDKIQSAGISKTQQYKMAGNSIVVDVLYHIFRKMFVDKTTSQLTLF